ncbi:hydrogenase formation protein HypD [bacterium CG_4_10_14_0_2_um_filter_33_32]|nr:MAG: hydrogenase formation protein HypD [bacterium CG2_30_33_46]PIR67748.1 MAG: hydrogenase formation protein HypD [bacterium CG10_big_fil_rev_8_21_14_0_10_33_18]PIU77189.1 MAG: hydrogenase formation protein HypD [bacterium CG06_land_8_20_14_3_00_33_50]PIW80991.1 MAG: hydrogenase formation protein HypD [bacterium CG_4_8_14_3_um_filter_33_28]PIY85270.1 MAG: hydrogenase formation protein HypD [bacterium CG_4_10_14_0_8_um_filter_33_57]PIZ86203.1 MAG: hydrogenase formation protein HypD [bacteri
MKLKNIVESIEKISDSQKQINIMEVCGTHTMAIHRLGIKSLLPKNINLISGPGCPVCVTSVNDLNKIIFLAKQKNVITLTYGDLFRVPGEKESLERVRSEGHDVRIIYSVLDSIKVANDNPEKKIIFIAVGFETTAPTTAALVEEVYQKKVKNLLVLSLHKTVPEALLALLKNPKIMIDGFILPGHVSTVIGSLKPYKFISDEYNKPAVVSGFEAEEILESILLLLKMFKEKKPSIINQYKKVVTSKGNIEAQRIMNKIFERTNAEWRGLGIIRKSGLKLNKKYVQFSVDNFFKISLPKAKENLACKCGEIIQGLKQPKDCLLFSKNCTPEKPIGPCMVSSEGTCAAFYKYGGYDV